MAGPLTPQSVFPGINTVFGSGQGGPLQTPLKATPFFGQISLIEHPGSKVKLTGSNKFVGGAAGPSALFLPFSIQHKVGEPLDLSALPEGFRDTSSQQRVTDFATQAAFAAMAGGNSPNSGAGSGFREGVASSSNGMLAPSLPILAIGVVALLAIMFFVRRK